MQLSDAIVKDQKPHSSVNKEGLGFFTFQILDVNPLVNALAASGKFSWQPMVKNMAEVVHSYGCNH